MTLDHQLADKGPRAERGRRNTRRIAVVFLGVAMLFALPWCLDAVGRYLAAEAPLEQADAVVVLSGDHRLQHAANLLKTGVAQEVWLLEREPTYVVTAGLFPANHAVEADALRSLGVSESQIRVLPGSMREIDDAAYMITAAIQKTGSTDVIVICHRPHGRNVRWVVDHVLRTEQAKVHLNVLAARADEFTDANWWRRRTGWKEVFNASCQLMFTMVRGIDPQQKVVAWDADAYEQEFLSTMGTGECHSVD